MRRELPWWANPWRLRRERDAFAQLADRFTDVEAALTGECARLRNECDLLRAKLRSALLGSLHTATAAQHPEFVLIGIDRGNGLGKRLIAGRDLPGAELCMTSMDDPPPRWKITATLARPLFIDRADYAAALEHMRVIWQNWDADQPTTAARAIPDEPPARGAIEP